MTVTCGLWQGIVINLNMENKLEVRNSASGSILDDDQKRQISSDSDQMSDEQSRTSKMSNLLRKRTHSTMQMQAADTKNDQVKIEGDIDQNGEILENPHRRAKQSSRKSQVQNIEDHARYNIFDEVEGRGSISSTERTDKLFE